MMDEQPDFETLRAERNAATERTVRKLQAEGWLVSPCAFEDDAACYCACSQGGPCEHAWDGEWWQSEDGRESSATCSRCGMTAMSHSMRCGP